MTQPDTATSLMLQAIEQLAALQQQVGVLSGQANIIIQEQERANDGRKQIYDRIREVEMAMATVKRIAPLVDLHEQRYQQGQGAVWLFRMMWGAVAGGGGALMVVMAKKLGLIN